MTSEPRGDGGSDGGCQVAQSDELRDRVGGLKDRAGKLKEFL